LFKNFLAAQTSSRKSRTDFTDVDVVKIIVVVDIVEQTKRLCFINLKGNLKLAVNN
jgi:hypothetical protein